MFRESYRRRSAITWSVWCGAFLVLCVFLAWRLDWLPGGGDGTPVEEESPAGTSIVNLDGSAENTEKPAETVDPAVFSGQGEPGDEFSEPARFRGGKDARPIDPVPALAKKKAQPAAKGQPPAFLNEFAPGKKPVGSGVRPAGYRGPARRDASAPPATLLSQIDRLIEQREYLKAHKLLSEIYWNKTAWRPAIQRRIEMTAKAIYFSPRPHLLRPYSVKYGDQLRTIARKYGINWEYIAMLNELPVRGEGSRRTAIIRPDQELKVIKGPFSLVVDLSDRELYVRHYNYYVRKYRIGIGRDKRSPVGKFKIEDRVVDPDYTGTDEKTGRRIQIPGKDPRNPLGSHWLKFAESYGIHGTIDPDSIGKAESRGCIRLLNSDVEEVYKLVTVGSAVVIQP